MDLEVWFVVQYTDAIGVKNMIVDAVICLMISTNSSPYVGANSWHMVRGIVIVHKAGRC